MPAVEKFHALDISVSHDFESVTPSNTEELSGFTRRLYVGGAGNLNVEKADGTQVFIQGVVAGAVLPIRIKKVRVDDGQATPGNATTATNILALY
jgi:hypothetical protein